MKILCYVHAYPPTHNAGAEWMLHTLNKHLVKQGHEVRVIVPSGNDVIRKNGKIITVAVKKDTEFEGIPVLLDIHKTRIDSFRWADVVVTHLRASGRAMNLIRTTRKPLVHLLHNTHHNDVIQRINVKNNHLVYNAKWNQKASRYKNDSIVIYPPVDVKDYRVRTNRKNITLVNCWPKKGGRVLIDLAKEMPDKSFIGVIGSYGDQVIGNEKNLTYVDNTPDIREVYRKTGILVMPSDYESWGRVAVEAMSSGIPVIAHPTPGLKESLGEAGIFADRDNIGEWVDAIRKLDDPDYYKEVSAKCKKRAEELSEISERQLEEFEEYLISLSKKGYQK